MTSDCRYKCVMPYFEIDIFSSLNLINEMQREYIYSDIACAQEKIVLSGYIHNLFLLFDNNIIISYHSFKF